MFNHVQHFLYYQTTSASCLCSSVCRESEIVPEKCKMLHFAKTFFGLPYNYLSIIILSSSAQMAELHCSSACTHSPFHRRSEVTPDVKCVSGRGSTHASREGGPTIPAFLCAGHFCSSSTLFSSQLENRLSVLILCADRLIINNTSTL